MNKELYDAYVSAGFIMGELALDTKKPKRLRTKNKVCFEKTLVWNANRVFYAVPSKGLMVIDVDVKQNKKGMDSLEKLADNLFMDVDELVAMASTRTGSGGIHIPVRINKPVKAMQDEYPDIDFQSYRANSDKCPPYVVCAGQEFVFEGTKYPYTLLTEGFTVHDIAGLEDELVTDSFIEPDDEDDDVFPTEHSARALELLNNIDPCCDEPTWFKIGTVLKTHVVDGFNVFDKWSSGCPEKYDSEGIVDKWESLPSKAEANVGMIVNMAKNEKFRKAADMIKTSTAKELKTYFSSKKWFGEPYLSDVDKQSLSKQVKDVLSLTLPNAKKIVNQTKPEKDVKDLDEVSWLDNIAYVESYASKYYLLNTDEKLGELACTGTYSKELAQLKKDMGYKNVMSAKTLVQKGLIAICSDHEYNPTISDKIYIDESGAQVLNIYKPDSRPIPAKEFTEEGTEAISTFVNHFKLIMDEGEANILLDWLAYSAQNFGKKILWTPLIQSAEGIGKSLIGNIMINHVFGAENAGTVDSNVVVSPQTSWATNTVLRVLEEIKLAGHNRYEVLNQLKPFITNDTVSRVEKYEASSEVRNYCNFIAFTNFKDAIPVTVDDRRWWVVHSRQGSIDSLEKEVGISRVDYFEPLHELARKGSKYGSEFYKWLLERDVSSFNPVFPPMSKHKARMMATEDSKTAYLSDLRDLIALTTQGVTQDVLSTRQLNKLILTHDEWEHDKLGSGELTTLLRKLDYTRLPKKIKSRNELHGVWFKKAGLSDTEVRKLFHETMKLPDIDMFDDLDIEDL